MIAFEGTKKQIINDRNEFVAAAKKIGYNATIGGDSCADFGFSAYAYIKSDVPLHGFNESVESQNMASGGYAYKFRFSDHPLTGVRANYEVQVRNLTMLLNVLAAIKQGATYNKERSVFRYAQIETVAYSPEFAPKGDVQILNEEPYTRPKDGKQGIKYTYLKPEYIYRQSWVLGEEIFYLY